MFLISLIKSSENRLSVLVWVSVAVKREHDHGNLYGYVQAGVVLKLRVLQFTGNRK